MRDVREFRARYQEFAGAGVSIACITRESPESNRTWKKRLDVPFAMLSDTDGAAGRALGVVRAMALGPWHLEMVRRTTMLIDARGDIAAVWGKIRMRGHSREVLELAKAAGVSPTSP